jgi:hypothetical protein
MKHPRSRGQVFGNACAFLEFGPSLKAASQRLLSEARRNRAQFGLDRHRPSWTGASGHDHKDLDLGQMAPGGITGF